jgi:integrase
MRLIEQNARNVTPDDFTPRALQNCEINCTDISGLVSAFVRNSLAPNTLRAYASDVETFIRWGGRIPASPQLAAEFLAAHTRSHAPSTLSRYLAAISKLHRVRSLPDPTSSELVKATMRGIRRSGLLHCEGGTAKPLIRDELFVVLGTMGSSLVDCRDRALLLVGFAGALRRSELVGLDVSDLEIAPQGLVVTLRRSKTDQLNEGHSIGLPYGRVHCPGYAVAQWLERSAIVSGPLFRSIDKHGSISKKRMSGEAVSRILKRRLAAAGLSPTGYSGHSLRAGFVTSAAMAGEPLWRIRSQTRHKSDLSVELGLLRDVERNLASVVNGDDIDPKVKVILHYLKEHDWLEKNGAIIFSQYFTTAEWVAEAICEAYPAEPVAVYAGGSASFIQQGSERRAAAREHIKTAIQNSDIRLVCATDAACEGLNLQRLGAQVNVDLPWNPSRLEQRKGRVQRIGQARDAIHVLSLRYAGTVEDEVYAALSDRFGDIYSVLGQLPDGFEDDWIDAVLKDRAAVRNFSQRTETVRPPMELRYMREVADDVGLDWEYTERVLSSRDLDAWMREGW